MFLHDYLLECEISTVRTQTLTFLITKEKHTDRSALCII